jgi:nucleotide-binding universal stress UspA family protein
MAFKDIIVSIDPSPSGTQRTQFALRFARRFKANLVGYYVGPTVGEYVTTASGDREDLGRAGHADGPQTAAAGEIAEAAERRFEEDRKGHGLEGTWLLSGDNPAQDIVGKTRTVDLAIVGLGNPDRSVSDVQGFFPEDVIVGSGVPVLGLPIANLPKEIGREVLLAWDASRGSSRAMNDALPLLADADSVTVLAVESDLQMWNSAQSAAAHLRRHGVKAEARQIPSAGMAIGDVILSYCEHLRADLVVAGAFGHSRLRESILGGVSQTLLRQMMIPVLMSH